MGLLFINALKGLKKRKVQMLGIVFCIMLSAGIYTAMNTAVDRLEDKYYSYLKEQNVEDFAFTPKIDYSKDYTAQEVTTLLENELKNIPENQKDVIKLYIANLYGMYDNGNINQLYTAVDYIFNNNGANDKKVEEKLKDVAEKYNFDYIREEEKVLTEEEYIYKIMPYNGLEQINIPFLEEGKMPSEDNEITILPKFASANNLKVGSTLKIGNNEYKIVGLASSPEHIMPLLSINKPIYEEDKDCIIYTNENTFKEFSGVKSSSYVAAFKDREAIFEIDKLQEIFKDNESISLSYTVALRLMRTLALKSEIESDRLFADYMLYLLLAISIVIILVITKKKIEDERMQIGVLKSLGYKSYKIAVSYLIYPIIGSLIGGTLGYIIGVLLHGGLTQVFVGYFNLPLGDFEFNYKYLINTTIIPMVFLSVLSYLVALFMLRKKPLELLKEGTNLKVNWFSKFISFISKKLNFNSRFKLALASRSLGKLFIVIITSFCTGMLIVLTLIGVNIFNSMLDNTFDGLKFNSMVSYQAAIESEASDTEDLIYSTDMTISKVQKSSDDKTYEPKDKKDKSYSITMSGIDDNPHYIELINNKKENITSKLKNDEDIILSSKIADLLDIKVDDYIYVKDSQDREYKFRVIGINTSYMANIGYVRREYLSNKVEGKYSYNIKYTCDDKYLKMSNIDEDESNKITNIFNISTLKKNMENQMSVYNGSIYMVISFASVLALIILLVIANIIVEENKKTISLMKVMGYKTNEISKIVLNIYTPFIIIAYILSIPAMEGLLKYIMNVIAKEMEMNIPISLSIPKAIIGLIGLLVGYYIAIFISRKSLNKVPLSVALKRE